MEKLQFLSYSSGTVEGRHGKRIHFIDRRFFIDKGKYKDEKKKEKKLSFVKNLLSMKCPMYEMELSMKYEMSSFYKMSYLWNGIFYECDYVFFL